VAHGGQSWLRRGPVDSFFSALLLLGGDAGGRRKRPAICGLSASVTFSSAPSRELQAALDLTPVGMTFLVTGRGVPFTAEGFGGWFRQCCTEAGLKGLSAHGLRKAAATRLAERGATAHELMAVFGWSTLREAERYTRAANRKALASGVMRKLRSGT
jgi:integrase